MIDKSKQYRTRDGREVRIYATDGYALTPIHGAILEAEGWRSVSWTMDGMWAPSHSHQDLIEVRPRIKRTVWLNVYDYGTQGCYETKWEADSCAGEDRLACVKVEIDCEEGEGL